VINPIIAPRRAFLTVISETMTSGQITDFVGVQPDEAVDKGEVAPNSIGGRPSKWTIWKLIEQGSASVDISQLLNALHGRILHIEPLLKNLRETGCEIILQLALYHSLSDETGGGFMRDVPLLRSLADIGASVDVDQYILPEE
jgi:Domain of unknown function (DUF4279)